MIKKFYESINSLKITCDMNLTKAFISLTDFVYSNKKNDFFKELGHLSRTLEIKPGWTEVHIALGRREEIKLLEFPEQLDFVKNIKIVLNQYQNFSSVIMITIEAELNESSLNLLQNNSNYEKNKNLLETYEKQIWEFWKENTSNTILIENELTTLHPISVIHFYLSSVNYDKFVNDVQLAIDDKVLAPVTTVLTNYGANTVGLTSVSNITNQSLSISTQHRAVYGDGGFDFSGIMVFDIKNETWPHDITQQYYTMVSFQHYCYWIKVRKQQIISWKDDIEKLSKIIKEYVHDYSNYNPSEGFSLFTQKSSFQTEYASLMDELRYLQRIVGNRLDHIHDNYYGEHVLKADAWELNDIDLGLLKNLSTEIIDESQHLQTEFDVIKGQYQILGEELSELTNFVNTQQNLKLANNNEKVQKNISRQGLFMLGFTAAVLIMTYSLFELSSNQFEIENFEPRFSTNMAHIVLIDPFALKQFEYAIPIHLSTMTSHNYQITIFPENNSIKVDASGPCYLEGVPKISLPEPSIFFLKSGGDEIDLEPRFRFDYQDTLPYFSPEKMEHTVFHAIGSMKFNVTAHDLQEPEKVQTFLVGADLTMRIPSDFDYQHHCEK